MLCYTVLLRSLLLVVFFSFNKRAYVCCYRFVICGRAGLLTTAEISYEISCEHYSMDVWAMNPMLGVSST